MIKGFLGDMTGFADTCRVVPYKDIHKEQFHKYVLSDETAYIHFQSGKLEYIFTDQALITVVGETSASKKRLVARYEYDANPLTDIVFETAGFGLSDLDCELMFKSGEKAFHLDVHKHHVDQARECYKCLSALSREIVRNRDKLEFFLRAQGSKQTQIHLDKHPDLPAALDAISMNTHQYLEDLYESCSPNSYKQVFEQYFPTEDYQTSEKKPPHLPRLGNNKPPAYSK